MTEPVFDRAALDNATAGDATLEAALIRLFLEEAERLGGRLDAARDPLDRAELGAAAHRLRGSAGVVGAMRLRAACARLEERIAESSEEVSSLVARLLAAIHEARDALAAEAAGGER